MSKRKYDRIENNEEEVKFVKVVQRMENKSVRVSKNTSKSDINTTNIKKNQILLQ